MRPPAPRSALEHQAPHATRRIEGTIPVRAVRRGYYDHHVKEVGDTFMLSSKEELGSWMVLVTDEEQTVGAETNGEGEKTEKPKNGKAAKTKAEKVEKGEKTENDVL